MEKVICTDMLKTIGNFLAHLVFYLKIKMCIVLSCEDFTFAFWGITFIYYSNLLKLGKAVYKGLISYYLYTNVHSLVGLFCIRTPQIIFKYEFLNNYCAYNKLGRHGV